jgi:helicase
MLRGLFIGIDRYPAPINRLSCAKADALAIGSLFKDNSEGVATLLLDADATKRNIEAALDDLQSAAVDDLVVITFSGHGTDDHRLVPVDADASDLEGSCLALDALAQKLDAIQARHLIVVLDCCFAGGFGGARVFAPTAARSPVEDRTLVEGLVRGEGRVVLTASGRGEPALETQRFGHGLFSYHLLEALQGVGELATADQIPFYDLLNYVTTSVVDSARLLNDVQTPTVYGSIEGAPTLPRLIPGEAYAAAFPDRVRLPATADWNSLLPYGLSQAVIDRWTAAMPNGLNPLQLRAINDYRVLDGSSLLVVAPTSSGKTLIGEVAAVREAERGSRAVMLLPLRALVNDKYDYLRALYGDHLTIVRATGEHSDQVGDIYSGQYDLALLTYEKFLNIVTGSPWVLRALSLVVVDEAQNISDPSRGPALEFLLTLLRSGHARGGAPQIIALSAVIGDSHGLERWLDAGLLKTEDRPVPLRESMVDGAGRATHLQPDGAIETDDRFIGPAYAAGGQGNKPIVIPLVQRLVREGKKVIVFRAVKGETVGTASYLSTTLGLPPATSVLEQLPARDLSESSNSLRQVLQGGVGFHNADLSPQERTALETRFRDPASDLKVIVATTTLAMGINTPAEAVVIAGLIHRGPSPTRYSVAEYKNMVGRAGRLGFAQAGESYIVATGDPTAQEAWSRYILGNPEEVTSHFLDASTDPQTLILRSLVALGGSVDQTELLTLLENSFAVWQRIDRGGNGWDHDALQRDLQALLAAGLLDIEPTGLLTVTELGRFAGESGLEVRSVTQVSSLLRFVQARPLSDTDLVVIAQVTVELDNVYLPLHTKSRQEQARWPQTLAYLGVQPNLLQGLHVGGGSPVARAKRAAASIRFASRTPLANVEQELMQHLRDRSAAGPIRAVAGRTRDVIEAVATICRVRGVAFANDQDIDMLGIRLEIGLPKELAELGMLAGNTLTRANYLDLLDSGLSTPDGIRAADIEQLKTVIGETTASSLIAVLNDDAR